MHSVKRIELIDSPETLRRFRRQLYTSLRCSAPSLYQFHLQELTEEENQLFSKQLNEKIALCSNKIPSGLFMIAAATILVMLYLFDVVTLDIDWYGLWLPALFILFSALLGRLCSFLLGRGRAIFLLHSIRTRLNDSDTKQASH